jgi:hypothetical protein
LGHKKKAKQMRGVRSKTHSVVKTAMSYHDVQHGREPTPQIGVEQERHLFRKAHTHQKEDQKAATAADHHELKKKIF